MYDRAAQDYDTAAQQFVADNPELGPVEDESEVDLGVVFFLATGQSVLVDHGMVATLVDAETLLPV